MKKIPLYLMVSSMLFICACSDEDTPGDNLNCGKNTSTRCYAHNWQDFSKLNNLVDGDGVYTHTNDNAGGITSFVYKVSLKNVCPHAILNIDLSNTVEFGTTMSFDGGMYINGDFTSIPMFNLNGIVTGHLNKTLNGDPISTITIYNLISYPNAALGFPHDTAWYNAFISSQGMEIKFQNPK